MRDEQQGCVDSDCDKQRTQVQVSFLLEPRFLDVDFLLILVDFRVTANVDNHADGVVCIPEYAVAGDEISICHLDLHVLVAGDYAFKAVEVVVRRLSDYVSLKKLQAGRVKPCYEGIFLFETEFTIELA